MKISLVFVQNIKTHIPQNVHFRCELTQVKDSLKKLRKTFKLQKEILKTEMNHDEVYADNWRAKKDEWLDNAKRVFYVLPFHMLDLVNQWKTSLDLA